MSVRLAPEVIVVFLSPLCSKFQRPTQAPIDLNPKITGICRRTALVALSVGAVLDANNQGDTPFAGERSALLKAALTYVIPSLGSARGALANAI